MFCNCFVFLLVEHSANYQFALTANMTLAHIHIYYMVQIFLICMVSVE